jgi:exosome complex RNA-binding protein Csl4
MKRTFIFIIAGILIFLIGTASGLLIASYNLKVNKEKICSPKVRAEISPERIKDITSLKPGQVIYGKVISKENNQITLNIQLVNPLNTEGIKTISVNIPIEAKDEIIRFKKNPNSPDLEAVKSSLEEIKIDDYLTIKILPGKKVIYLPTQFQ